MTKQPLDIIFENDRMIVLNKPAGVLSIPDRFNKEKNNLKTILTEKFGSIFVVHRLDRETSGAIIFAKDAEAHKELNSQFENREVKKLYHAIIYGTFKDDELRVDIPLAPNPLKKGLMMPTVRGKASITIMKPIERFRIATLIECDMLTGRQHQIRVHCSAIGHPLFVDKDYGKQDYFMLSSIKKRFNLKKETEEAPILNRTPLHSYQIEIKLPGEDTIQSFTAEYPKDFSTALNVLRKYAKL